jgi:YidC/Oxa1 family membrane protein insertase
MAFLSSIASAFYNIGVTAPTGGSRLWEFLILDVFNWGFLANYGWRVLLFTILLKVLLSPVDIFTKVSSRKNQKIMRKYKDTFDQIERQYASDPRMQMQKRNEFQKKVGGGINPLLTCLPLILTMVIFITLFNGLGNIGAYKNLKQYITLYNEYKNVSQCVWTGVAKNTADDHSTLSADGIVSAEREEAYKKYFVEGTANYVASLEDTDAIKAAYAGVEKNYDALHSWVMGADFTDAQAEKLASYVGSRAVYYMYDDVAESFLWIKNIWAVDAPWVSSVSSYSDWSKNIQRDSYNSTGKLIVNTEVLSTWNSNVEASNKKEIMLTETYNDVMRDLLASEGHSANGYLILPVLSVLMALLSMFVSQQQQKSSGQDAGMAGKTMLLFMPIMIGVFAFIQNAAFSLYLVASYFVSTAISLVMTLIYYLIDRKEDDVEEIRKYGRPNFNDGDNK